MVNLYTFLIIIFKKVLNKTINFKETADYLVKICYNVFGILVCYYVYSNLKVGINLGDYMNQDIIFNILLLVIIMVLFLVYSVFVICDERRKLNEIKYYKTNIKFSCDYFKYMNMVKEIKKVIFKKQVQLMFLQLLVFLKGIFIWKN